MSVRQRVVEAVLGKSFIDGIKKDALKNVKEAVIGARKEDEGWRSLTDDSKRDLSPLKQERMQEIAFHLYETNPIAHRMVEMTKDFVVGEGITFDAEDKAVQELLNEFWYDPINAWDLKQGTRIMELGLYGEQLYPVAVNEINGKVRMGYLDPTSVSRVVTDPDNVEIVRQIKRKGTVGRVQKTYKVVNPDEDTKSKTHEYLVGDIFYFAINKVANAKRGRSDLYPLADFLDGYDQFLFNLLERSHLMNVFLWDVELKGYDQTKIDEWLAKQTIPQPASMRAHNERVKYEAVVPELGSHDASEAAKLFRNTLMGGAGWPPHWFAGGEQITRATAQEMTTPVMKKLKTRQRYFKYMIEYIFLYVIHQAKIHGRQGITKDTSEKVKVNMPKLLEKDIYTLSLGLKFIMDALATGIEKEWVSEKDAKRIFAYMMSQLGMEIVAEENKDRGGKS